VIGIVSPLDLVARDFAICEVAAIVDATKGTVAS
jgi:hypothetical protein